MKIVAFTSIRSDYDLLSGLYFLLNKDENIDFSLVVSGAHLSNNFGNTIEQIKSDGFKILAQIETLINADSVSSKLKTASILLQNSIDVINIAKPDLLLYAGDREDVIMYGLIGTYLKIPTIHFYGGDHEAGGHEDTVIRHATSKLSTYHFVSNVEHMQRLISMGENPKRIHNIGSISLDRIVAFNPIDITMIYKKLQLTYSTKPALVIYHPTPSMNENDSEVFDNILSVLNEMKIPCFASYPNTDSNNSKILSIIDRYSGNENIFFFKNLDRELFLSIFKQAYFIIGNSSAGIYESASIPIPAINVGARQTGRLSNRNVQFCGVKKNEIREAIFKAMDGEYLNDIRSMINIFGEGNSAVKAYNLIKKLDFKSLIIKSEDPLNV